MQSECNRLLSLFSNIFKYATAVRRCFWVLVPLALAAGCGQSASTVKSVIEPYKSKSLWICCSSSVDPLPIRQFAEQWSALNGADIRVTSAADRSGTYLPDAADVMIVSSAELPALAENGRFLPVAPAVMDREHVYQWELLLRNYSGLLAAWNGVAYGVPLLGEGYVLVYRKDRLAEAPEDWDGFVKTAERLAKSGRPSLPALPSTPLGLETEFHLIASCYDRSTMQQGELGSRVPDDSLADRLYSYHYRLKTDEPRINAPAFVEAFELLRRMRPYRAAEKQDPLLDLLDGTASLAIVDLKDLARLQHDPTSQIRGKLGIAKLPGARFVFDLDGKKLENRVNDVNRTPYLGYGSWMGMVNKTCANPDMAFEFLAGFGNPEQMGAELITAAKWGAGPLRAAQIEERARGLWFGYDLTPADTEALISALKQNIASSIVNTRYRLRLPNRQQHLDKFERIVRPALQADAADGQKTLDAVAEAWRKLWAGVPEQTKKAWIKHSCGL
jgi:multiple sugar transport system substrate-binding protein